jgi:hypothetical protein
MLVYHANAQLALAKWIKYAMEDISRVAEMTLIRG